MSQTGPHPDKDCLLPIQNYQTEAHPIPERRKPEHLNTMYLTFSPSALELAYRHAIFPMYNHYTGEIEWYRPNPRAIIPLDGFHVSRSLAKTIRKGTFDVTFDMDFEGVMRSEERRVG